MTIRDEGEERGTGRDEAREKRGGTGRDEARETHPLSRAVPTASSGT